MKKTIFMAIMIVSFTQSISALENGKNYVLSDLGYNTSGLNLNDKIANGENNNKALFQNTDNCQILKGFIGNVGFGYALTNSVRTDFVFKISYGQKVLEDISLTDPIGAIDNRTREINGKYTKSKKASIKRSTISIQEKKTIVMTNVYYDFNNFSEFTPYLMAGIGMNLGSLDIKVSGYQCGVTGNLKPASESIKSKISTRLAYQIGTGVTYEVLKDIQLDVGYKIFQTTESYKFKKPKDIEFKDIDVEKDYFGHPRLQHILTTGIRFEF